MSSSSNSDANKAFIKKFKKDNNVKVQTKLPSRVEHDNELCIARGNSLIDANWWRRFIEEVKFDPMSYAPQMVRLFEMAQKCNCHPTGLIYFGRTTYGWKQFGRDEIDYLRDNLIADDDDAEGSGSYEETSAPYDPSQPYPDNPTSEEAYAIDDDDEAAFEAARGKRKVRPGEMEE